MRRKKIRTPSTPRKRRLQSKSSSKSPRKRRITKTPMNKKSIQCKQKLQQGISAEMRAYKKGIWVSRAQAIAVAYNKLRKNDKVCSKYI